MTNELTYPLPGQERPAPDAERVQGRLLAWFEIHGRAHLPWRRTRDPYAILVSEMMLQQTGVERVLPKYEAWLRRFPTLEALAAAPRSEAIRLWAGLGYNSRAVRLQDIARQAVAAYGGRLPATLTDLRALKGIGPYTAGAVLCFAHEQDVAFVDTNVRRVLGRIFLGPEGEVTPPTERELYDLAERALPRGRAWPWYQALMDLGATICTDGKPACLVCPLCEDCRAAFRAGRVAREGSATYKPKRPQGPWQGSARYYRGRIVAALSGLPPGARLPLADLAAGIRPPQAQEDGPEQGQLLDPERLRELVARLAADGLVTLHEAPNGMLEVALPE